MCLCPTSLPADLGMLWKNTHSLVKSQPSSWWNSQCVGGLGSTLVERGQLCGADDWYHIG